MKLYLSGALASAPNLQSACAHYDAIAKGLSAYEIQVYVPHHFTHPRLHKNVTPAEVYANDARRLLCCDAVLALLDSPSLGVGAEIALALANGRPVLGVVGSKRASRVSRYVTGLLSTSQFPELVIYEDVNSLVRLVAGVLSRSAAPEHERVAAAMDAGPALD